MANSRPTIRLTRIGRVRQLFRENEWVYLIVGLMGGLLLWPLVFVWLDPVGIPEFLTSLVPEAVGITFTVLILDRLDLLRERRLIKEQLMRQLHSYYNPTALQAVEELRILGWLDDGSLRGLNLRGADLRTANLYQADLQGTDLINAKLQGVDFYEANLKDAKVTDEQLAAVITMRGATMPDGARYDGRYNLPHDFNLMRKKGIDARDPAAVAGYYGVEVEHYEAGQAWARENLDALRQN
jgi:hypothetical protein